MILVVKVCRFCLMVWVILVIVVLLIGCFWWKVWLVIICWFIIWISLVLIFSSVVGVVWLW